MLQHQHLSSRPPPLPTYRCCHVRHGRLGKELVQVEVAACVELRRIVAELGLEGVRGQLHGVGVRSGEGTRDDIPLELGKAKG